MADETLETRRWLRQRLSEIATQYPELTDAEHQQRLEAELVREAEPAPPAEEARDVPPVF